MPNWACAASVVSAHLTDTPMTRFTLLVRRLSPHIATQPVASPPRRHRYALAALCAVLLLAAAWPLANTTHAQLRFSDFPQVIDGSSGAVLDVTTADLDGDDDLDVIAASSTSDEVVTSDQIVFYRNDGSGSFGPAETILSATEELSAGPLYAVDIDGDGDVDILS